MALQQLHRTNIHLAIREEGEFVNAYVCDRDDADAILLGAIRATIRLHHPDTFKRFESLMIELLGDMLKEAGLDVRDFVRVETPPQPSGTA